MINFTYFFDTFMVSESFLLIAKVLSLMCKLYLIVVLTLSSLRSTTSKKLFLLLITYLSGTLLTDISWLLWLVQQIFRWETQATIIALIIRIAWTFWAIQYQVLAYFLEYLIENKIKFKQRHIVFTLLNSVLTVSFIYLTFFNKYTSFESKHLEMYLVQTAYLYIVPLLGPLLYTIYQRIKAHTLPNIVRHQLKIFVGYLIFPHLLFDIVSSDVLFPNFLKNAFPLIQHLCFVTSSILGSYAMYYCCKNIIRLRFLNSSSHVQESRSFNFIDDFKTTLEQLSHVTAMSELAHITQTFFKSAFSVPLGRTRLYTRTLTPFSSQNTPMSHYDTHYDIAYITNTVEDFLMHHDQPSCAVSTLLRHDKICIKDELEFTNFYEQQEHLTHIVTFLDAINADIFLPIYEQQTITGYIIIERHARGDRLYSDVERDEMLVFTSYLGNIINILKHNNLEALLRKERELEEEIHHKHQEINHYTESIKSFLQGNNGQKIGILFYKNRKFTCANQEAQELIGIDINTHEGHPLCQTLRQLARSVQQYKTSQSTLVRTIIGGKLMLAGILSLESNTVIITVYHPDVSDIIKAQFNLLKDPTQWDYMLYLETTASGQLINQLIPGSSTTLLNFKIKLLSTALSRKATLLEMADDDVMPTVEVLHHISLRQTLHTLKITTPEKNNEIAIKLFGINPLLDKNESESLLQKMDTLGTLFIQNVHYLSIETQHQLAQFIIYGYYHKIRSDTRYFSNVRIICSTTKNLHTLVVEGLFSKALFNELKKMSVTLPSLVSLQEQDISELAQGFTEQALTTQTFKNLLELNTKDKDKLLDQRPASLQELKARIQQILMRKSTKHAIQDKTEFDPAYHISDPELATIIRRGKKALKYQQDMTKLWDVFQNQNKIATLLGVDRSTVSRVCRKYSLTKTPVVDYEQTRI